MEPKQYQLVLKICEEELSGLNKKEPVSVSGLNEEEYISMSDLNE